MNKDKMLGCKVPTGPGGRKCNCCAEAPRHRTRDRRAARRREKQALRLTY